MFGQTLQRVGCRAIVRSRPVIIGNWLRSFIILYYLVIGGDLVRLTSKGVERAI